MIVWRLNSQARLRHTPNGGAAFLPSTVMTVELDNEAFTVLLSLAKPQTARELRPQLITQFNRNFTVAEIEILLRTLNEQQFVVEAQDRSYNPSDLPQAHRAPESVHLQLNNVCNLRCPSCYLELSESDPGVLSLERIQALIDEWVEMGVFQLALGGGEPLMSHNFAPVARYARARGIVPNVTTNGRLITERLIAEVGEHLGELRLSLNDALTVNTALLEEKAELLRAWKARFGFNLIVTRQNLDRLPELLRWTCDQGAATVNLIRPKPAPGNEQWYEHNALSARDSSRLATMLLQLEHLFVNTSLTVDCAFSFLFYAGGSDELRRQGLAGCAMGERFVTVKWNGDVYPCSHLHGEEFNAGNVTHKTFRQIWEKAPVLTQVRRELGLVEGDCGRCRHNALCKGCRAVMRQQTGNWLAADHDCGFRQTALTQV
jgi:pyrroloquinoline quinone biosynthesis protein E